jgi:hypothetical protein
MPDLRHIGERTATTPKMGAILTLFSDGKKRYRSEASKALSISDRVFRANVERLNILGYPIISEGDGFFMATTPEQIQNAKVRLEATRDSLDKRIHAYERMQAEMLHRQEGVKQLKLL